MMSSPHTCNTQDDQAQKLTKATSYKQLQATPAPPHATKNARRVTAVACKPCKRMHPYLANIQEAPHLSKREHRAPHASTDQPSELWLRAMEYTCRHTRAAHASREIRLLPLGSVHNLRQGGLTTHSSALWQGKRALTTRPRRKM